MKKKSINIALIVLAAFILIVFYNKPDSFVHTSLTDRFNPFIEKTTTYAQVPTGTQSYHEVQGYNSKDGHVLSYKLKKVGGYDPQGKYVAIEHKGQYVKSIKYISKQNFLSKIDK
ncbi:YxeA family protein [uncultured Lactobacillus sp.]|uniref:YxeA family protein n=1 Tax=uncultured Lactobacillus sp. TaxID=153152 RepID=UPI00260ABB47|nr:YxeA family protein [uncultured Lactobacillus sp.]